MSCTAQIQSGPRHTVKCGPHLIFKLCREVNSGPSSNLPPVSPIKTRQLVTRGIPIHFPTTFNDHSLDSFFKASAAPSQTPPVIITAPSSSNLHPPPPVEPYNPNPAQKFTFEGKAAFDSCTEWDQEEASSLAKKYSRNMATLHHMETQHASNIEVNQEYVSQQRQHLQQLRDEADDAKSMSRNAVAEAYAAAFHARQAAADAAAKAERAFLAEEQLGAVEDSIVRKRRQAYDKAEAQQLKKSRALHTDQAAAEDVVKAGYTIEMSVEIPFWS